MAVLESLSWGTPTVISTGCHFPEVAEDDVGWVHEMGTDPLIETLKSVLADPTAARLKAMRGREWVAHKFNWNHIERQYHALYQRMVSSVE